MKSFTQVYTGNGKGKTTAALGLLLRACGAGLRVYLGQFIKCADCSEIKLLKKRFRDVTLEQYGPARFIKGKPSRKDIAAGKTGFAKLCRAVFSGKFDVVIADEINCAVCAGILPVSDVVELIRTKPADVELVLTGRGAHKLVMKHADLVTEMKEIKHYFRAGNLCRRGIEC
jgi:cob(I)alamin adenosyltransferase